MRNHIYSECTEVIGLVEVNLKVDKKTKKKKKIKIKFHINYLYKRKNEK